MKDPRPQRQEASSRISDLTGPRSYQTWGQAPNPTGHGACPQGDRPCATLRPCWTPRQQPCTRRVWLSARRESPVSASSTTVTPAPGSSPSFRSRVLGWAVLGPPRIPALWLLLPAAVFAALAAAHARVLRERDEARRAADFYRRGLARIKGEWRGTGSEGLTHLPDDHPYAADLDLFGHGSLFQLASSARLGGGEQMLARWLLQAAAPDEVRRRQTSVNELKPLVDLRERLALAGDEIAGYLDTTQLAAWGQAPSPLTAVWPRAAAAMLGAANAVSLGAAFLLDAGTGWFATSALASAAFALWWRRPVSHVLAAANAPVHQLNLLAEVFEVVEREKAAAPELEAIRRRLMPTGAPASVRIHELRRLMDLLSSRRNQFFAPIAALLLWGTQFAWAIEAWRRRNGPFLADWIDAIGEFEALCSLAGYAFEHPDDPFPDLIEGEAMFDGEALGASAAASARCRTTCGSTATRACWSSRDRTCRARARCSARSASRRCWRWPARRCARGASACRRLPSAPRCGFRTPCRRAGRGSSPR